MNGLPNADLLPWLDALISDVVFGWRQLRKNRVVSTAAILSLALAIGATTAAFRLVDAVLLRTLPVADPGRLFLLAVHEIDPDGKPGYRDDFDYPTFRKDSKTLSGIADVMVIGFNARQSVTAGGSDQAETIHRQFISGNVFGVLGMQPAAGRLLTPDDGQLAGPGIHFRTGCYSYSAVRTSARRCVPWQSSRSVRKKADQTHIRGASG